MLVWVDEWFMVVGFLDVFIGMSWFWKRGIFFLGRGVGIIKYFGNLEERDVISFRIRGNLLNMKVWF